MFEEMLKTRGSIARKTLVVVMCKDGRAVDEQDAIQQLDYVCANSGDVKNMVVAGLRKVASITGCAFEELILENDFSTLKKLSVDDVIEVCASIHHQWIKDNLDVKHLVTNLFEGNMAKYRNTVHIGFDEVKYYITFVQEYLLAGKVYFNDEELSKAYARYAAKNANCDITDVAEHVKLFSVYEIIEAIKKYGRKYPENKAKIKGMLTAIKEEEIVNMMLSEIKQF